MSSTPLDSTNNDCPSFSNGRITKISTAPSSAHSVTDQDAQILIDQEEGSGQASAPTWDRIVLPSERIAPDYVGSGQILGEASSYLPDQ